MPRNSLGQFRAGSTCVATAAYDEETGDLTIDFQQRGAYVYHGVSPDEAADFQDAASMGTYFNLYIKDRYDYERVG